MPSLCPVSVIIPTRDRTGPLRRTLESLAQQSHQPSEIVIVDASCDPATQTLCDEHFPGLLTKIKWQQAISSGAASQRNEGVLAASFSTIGFMDDDIIFEPSCFARLHQALQSDPQVGGVNAMITNQSYHAPGKISAVIFRLIAGREEGSYAGKVLGPAVNLLPEDSGELPEMVPVEWLNTTCTLYRRECLPQPPFLEHFVGYSLMEDLALSIAVGRKWKLLNARTARIYHDSQPGVHKSDPLILSRMQFTNRYFVMTKVLNRTQPLDYCKFALFELFSLVSTLQTNAVPFGATLLGKISAVLCIAKI